MLSLMPESQSILLLEQPTRGLDLNQQIYLKNDFGEKE